MVLTDKETTVIKDLQTQEKSCIEKYTRYSKEAHDTQLRDLFRDIAEDEKKHHETLRQILSGKVPCCDCNDSRGRNYQPKATYNAMNESDEKKADCFLVTDCIGTEKLVSSEYNSDVFVFGNSDVRKALADIQIEEQNHAEMLWKYKTVNGMTNN
ncbi:MAG: ferritin-like domain-containing protein [Lachnospiraceae bacterium]|nr:ferritin-like domain-containing protein [Lachnospiraceae bacterium]